MRLLIIVTLISIAAIGCKNNIIFEEKASINDGWSYEDSISFTFNVVDTTSLHHLKLHVGHENTYPFANIWFSIVTKFPDGSVEEDDLSVDLATPSGQWLGKGNGSIKQREIYLQHSFIFDKLGQYEFIFMPNMRTNPLDHITNIGLSIEKEEI